MDMLHKSYLYVGLLLIVGLAVFFAVYHLSESPRVWMDEGILIQTSRNLAEQGMFKTQIAPGEFVSSGYVSTSCTILCPVALAFKIFDTDIIVARSVMAVYIIALVVIVALLVCRFIAPTNILLSLISVLLVVTFAPLYGHGRNVLGEIPGLLYLGGAVYCLYTLEVGTRYRKLFLVLFGLLAGLSIVTKPIFLLLLPALAVAGLIAYKRQLVLVRELVLIIGVLFVPILSWISIQFSGDGFIDMLKVYTNPQDVDIISFIWQNIIRFLTESQPLYMITAFLVWTSAVGFRLWKKKIIPIAEWLLYIFSFLVIIAYIRTIGYYRYFFLAQFWCLVYVIPALDSLTFKRWCRTFIECIFVVLIMFQVFSLMNTSWVAMYWNSTLTQELKSYVTPIAANKTVFVHQAPELVTFLPHNNYWQYLKVTPTIILGEDMLNVLELGIPDVVMIGDTETVDPKYLDLYGKVNQIDHYSFFVKNK